MCKKKNTKKVLWHLPLRKKKVFFSFSSCCIFVQRQFCFHRSCIYPEALFASYDPFCLTWQCILCRIRLSQLQTSNGWAISMLCVCFCSESLFAFCGGRSWQSGDSSALCFWHGWFCLCQGTPFLQQQQQSQISLSMCKHHLSDLTQPPTLSLLAYIPRQFYLKITRCTETTQTFLLNLKSIRRNNRQWKISDLLLFELCEGVKYTKYCDSTTTNTLQGLNACFFPKEDDKRVILLVLWSP